ncbi:Crp/Fnr family transcriptional regulator [Neobacillus notoginsengisoli]|uniref:Crp/Fnr family transcriptional regulator n=1 Tax=Neobacillus notoginsengisoli TaxID=1578198 RepID=A0A417YXB6_9BACI|nr:Crp/Fnr family transcriptional regulator [Neobacillus notoginsengisoli]RHW42214.1 Crp/Fnr family transcriptional regulator [Neobacillus notoginsengisoli]
MNDFSKSPALSYELNELLKSANRRFHCPKGTYVFREGQDAAEVYIILSGKVQVSKMNSEGQELLLRLCCHNDIVGELTLFTVNPKYIFSARAVEDTEIAALGIPDLEKAFFQNSQLAYEFLKWMNDHMRKTMTKFKDLVLYGKKGALYSTLIRLSNSYGIPKEDGIYITVPVTTQDLANFCGTAREIISRMLGDLKREKVISVKAKKITIHNLEFLKTENNCENCPIEYCNVD